MFYRADQTTIWIKCTTLLCGFLEGFSLFLLFASQDPVRSHLQQHRVQSPSKLPMTCQRAALTCGVLSSVQDVGKVERSTRSCANFREQSQIQISKRRWTVHSHPGHTPHCDTWPFSKTLASLFVIIAKWAIICHFHFVVNHLLELGSTKSQDTRKTAGKLESVL